MPRCRKRHVQVDLEFHRRGGRRKGAGRKPAPGRRRVSHAKRSRHDARNPVHITLRVLDGAAPLRRRDAFKVLRSVMLERLGRTHFRVVHASIQGNHIHMMCEADDRLALSRGVQGFKISTAKRLNKIRNRSGEVFADRYHEEVLTSPTQVRRCLAYVLNNWRRHEEDRGATTRYDPFSTGMWFTGWKETPGFAVPADADVLPSARARTWVLADGWKRGGPLISLFEVPGPRS
jgi:REP element-mobilizing transposase RayT